MEHEILFWLDGVMTLLFYAIVAVSVLGVLCTFLPINPRRIVGHRRAVDKQQLLNEINKEIK